VTTIDVTSAHLLLGKECEPRIAGADVDAGIGG
jgi:hypothetical protein